MSDPDKKPTYDREYPTCPYCSHEHGEIWDFDLTSDGDTTETECDECGAQIKVTVAIATTFTTEPIAPPPPPEEVKDTWTLPLPGMEPPPPEGS